MKDSAATTSSTHTSKASKLAKQTPVQAAAPVSQGAEQLQGAVEWPAQASPAAMLGLQRLYGNRAVQGLVQRAAVDAEGGELGLSLQGEIDSARGGGQPLDAGAGAHIGQALGADFGRVRVHTDAQSDTLNRSLSAQAFTLGNDIFFSQGAYGPGSTGGRRLLAHELTHVAQQGARKTGGIQTKLQVGPADDPFEREADRVAEAVTSGASSRAQRQMARASLRRKTIKPVSIQRKWPWSKKKDQVISGPTNVKNFGMDVTGEEDLRKNITGVDGATYTKPMIKAGPNNAISRPMKGTEKTGDAFFQQDDAFDDDKSKYARPSSEDIILKPNEEGEDGMKHSTTAYLDLLANYVKQGGVDHGMVSNFADILAVDFQDVREGRKTFEKLERALEVAEIKVDADSKNPVAPKKEKKKNLKERDELAQSKKKLQKALGEPDFEKAEGDASARASEGQKTQMTVTTEKATIEHLYDEVRDSKKVEHKRTGAASRKQKKNDTFKDETAQIKQTNADASRKNAQQAKLSFDVIKLKRKGLEMKRDHVRDNLGRIAGTMRKLAGTIAGGAIGALLNIVTLGALGLKSNVNQKGFQGEGLEKKGRAFKVTFFNDIRNQMAQYRTTIASRPKGPKIIDYISALLRAFNEVIVQNVVKIAGNVALVAGLLATVILAASLGFAAPAAAPLAAISAIAAVVSLIAAAVKVAVDVLRIAIDGLTALFNTDAKKSNVLTSRVKQSGLETLGDTLQAAGTATGTGTGAFIKGHEFVNAFNPSQMVAYNITELTATHSIGTTVGSMGANLSQSVVAPLLGGPVAGGVAGALDEPLGLHTQHPDERGPSGESYLKARSSVSRPKKMGDDTGTPGWMQAEMQRQQKLRKAAWKSRKAAAVGQMGAVTTKASELGSKLGSGQSESTKIESNMKGKGDSEDTSLAQSQTGVLGESSGAMKETGEALVFSQVELAKLPDGE